MTKRPWWQRLYPLEGDLYKEDTTPGDEGFAPADPFDGRRVGEWRSRYPAEIHAHIVAEAVYLAVHGFAFLLLAAGAWLMTKGYLPAWGNWDSFTFSAAKWIGLGGLSFFGGALGGTLFGLKWLYHSVAKGIWSLDRRLWRVFTPWISGLLSIIVVALIAGNVMNIFRSEAMWQPATVFGVSALVGLFSDITLGKLAEVAKVLFGKATNEERATRQASPRNSGERGA